MLEKFLSFFTPEDPVPNKFTIYMGEKIRQAREEEGLSQQELAEKIYKRRPALSDYENGKAVVNSDTLALLAYYLNKPLEYFYPLYAYQKTKPEDLSPLEDELLKNFRYHIASDYFGKLVIDFIKMLGEFDTNSFVIEQAPYVKEFLKTQKDFEKFLEKRKKVEVNK
jgi:transcriptional regulator with XRE-family HTH domain